MSGAKCRAKRTADLRAEVGRWSWLEGGASVSPGDRLALAVRLACEAEVLSWQMALARRAREREGAGERAAREAVLADLGRRRRRWRRSWSR